jgi:hypothetical protein
MLAGLVACGGEPSAYAPRDPCAALAITTASATAVERDAIADALALWRDHGVTAFDQPAPGAATGAAPGAAPGAEIDPAPITAAIDIRFGDAAATFHGVYDPASASVVINRDLVDRAPLAIVIAHELGHVFGLAHVTAATRPSLMNPGNLITPPTDGDQRALEALWGACAPAAAAAR